MATYKPDPSRVSILAPPEEKKDTVSIIGAAPLLSTDVGNRRAEQYAYATGGDPNEIYNQIMNGTEQSLREHTARTETLNNEAVRMKMLERAALFLADHEPTEGELSDFQAMTMPQSADPNIIMEQLLARKTLNDLYNAQTNSYNGDSSSGLAGGPIDEDPEMTSAVMDAAESTITARFVAQRMLDDLGHSMEDKWWAAKAEQYTNYFIAGGLPFLRQYALHNVVKPPFETSFWQGNNTEEQYAYLYRLSQTNPSEFYTVLKAGVDDLAGRNIPLAQEFLNGFIQYGSTAAFLDSSINVADLGTALAPVAKTIGAATVKSIKGKISRPVTSESVKQFSDAVKSSLAQINPAAPDVKNVMAATGRSNQSAIARFYEKAKGIFYGQDFQKLAEDLLAEIPSFMDPGKFFRGAYKLTRQYADDIIERSQLESGILLKTLTAGRNVSSISPEALGQAFEIGRRRLQYEAADGGLANAVIDIDRTVLPEATPGNLGYNVMRLGKQDRTFFENKRQASYWMKEYGIKDGQIRSSGDGWFIQVVRPVQETDAGVKNFLVETANTTPQSWLTTFLDRWGLGEHRASSLRTPANRLSDEQREIRSVLTRGNQQFGHLLQLVGKPLTTLSKAETARINRFFDGMRRFEDVVNGNRVKGIEFRTMGEFETTWAQMFDQLPSQAETQAYMTYVKLNQYDYILRNLALYHFKARQGIRLWQVEKGAGWVEAARVEAINWADKDGNIRFIGPDGKPVNYIKRYVPEAKRKELDDLITNEGYQLLHIANPWNFDTKAPINFVMTKTGVSKNLPWKQIDYKGGGHTKYDYPFKIGQARTQKGGDDVTYFTGDNTVMFATSGAEARAHVKVLEQARQLVKAGGEYSVFKTLVDGRLPVDPELLWNRFKNGTLNTDMPFVDLRMGETSVRSPVMKQLLQGEYRSWQDSSLNLMKGADLEFTGKRGWDIGGYRGLAEEDEPLFQLVKPRLIDPLPMIASALQRVQRNRTLQPYQLRSAEHFVEEFWPVLKTENLEKMRRNPLATLLNPDWDINTQDRSLLAAARSYQEASLNLIGTTTEWQAWNRWQTTKLIDSIYNKLGKNAAEFTYDHILPRIPDPIRFFRQLAFHTKLGLFNPVQLWLQYQTFTNVMAFSPKHALPGLAGAWIMRGLEAGGAGVKGLLRDDARVLHGAKIAANFGWKEDEFIEMYDLMQRSGVFHIGPAHAWRSDALDPELFKSKAGQWLDKSLVFFNEGERGNLMAGFATAFREWRRANPYEKLTRQAEGQIMRRFEDLTVNMSHADSSALNRGIGAVAGQFFSYQERLAELFLGRRFTWQEKARAFSVYAAMYGIPVGASAVTTYPFYNDIRQWWLSHNKQPDNAAVDAMMNGIPAMLVARIFGEEYAISARLGPNGIPLWENLGRPDTTMWDIMLGAPGSVAGDILNSVYPLAMNAATYVTDEENPHTKVTLTDMLETFKNVSTLSNAAKAYTGITIGKYITNGGIIVDDEVTNTEALMMAVFGVMPTRINDVALMEEAMRGKAEAQAYYRKQAKKYWSLGWKETDPEARHSYFITARRWMMLGDFDLKERGDLTGEAISEYETRGDRVRRSFQKEFPETE